MRRAAPALLLLLGLLPLAAWADERFDHRGSLGLLIGGGGVAQENLYLLTVGQRDSGLRGLADLGGTWAIGENGNELAAWVRGTIGGGKLGLSVIGGYRGYFGYDRFKTFLDLDLALQAQPYFTLGPRIGGGVQYELSPIAGVYAGLAMQAAGGSGLLLSGELIVGLQLRSYLLEF